MIKETTSISGGFPSSPLMVSRTYRTFPGSKTLTYLLCFPRSLRRESYCPFRWGKWIVAITFYSINQKQLEYKSPLIKEGFNLFYTFLQGYERFITKDLNFHYFIFFFFSKLIYSFDLIICFFLNIIL